MMTQYRKLKEHFPKALLLFRLGDFYELFYEDALTASSILSIVLTQREARGVKVPMCGIPYHALERYVPRLLEAGYQVAICEQLEKPAPGKKVVARDVVRVLSPGTAQDLGFGKEKEHQFVLGVVPSSRGWGMAFLDAGTGDAKVSFLPSWTEVQAFIHQLEPKELICPQTIKEEQKAQLSALQLFFQERALPPVATAKKKVEERLRLSLATSRLISFEETILALSLALDYLEAMERKPCDHFHTLEWLDSKNYLLLDEATSRHLQLFPSASVPREQSLFGILDKTKTPMGSRTLRTWLAFPLLDKKQIEARLEVIEEGKQKWKQWEEIRKELASLYDLNRLASSLSLGRLSPRQLAQLRISLNQARVIREKLKSLSAPLITEQAQNIQIDEIAHYLRERVEDEPASDFESGHVVRAHLDPEFAALRSKKQELERSFLELEKKEREKTKIKSLKIGYNQVFGYFLEVSRPNLSLVPPYFKRKQTMAQGERFVTAELLLLQSAWEENRRQIIEKEEALYQEICAYLKDNLQLIQKAAQSLAICDALGALIAAALEYNYVRPEIRESREIAMKESRHPIVERYLTEPFVSNDVFFHPSDHQIIILTGPNMSGKSTYLRQVALIVIMAQMGSFVPAQECSLGLVDSIFSRVGAQDEIVQGRSTFLVEMEETARLLRHLTPNSLLILDEVGRGTGTFDGLSLAQAVIEYLALLPQQPRVLFATHFLELTSLEKAFPHVKNYTVLVKEKEGKISFLHKIIKGSADKSYGLYVAEMAGIPEPVLKRAKELLRKREKGARIENELTAFQPPLFVSESNEEKEIRKEIEKLELETMTPLEALCFLDKLKRKKKNL